jgi:murein DD-endopeptidase MepM/ murein hydrolase activator NlpD
MIRNPVAQTVVRPYGSPPISGNWRFIALYGQLDSAHTTPHNGLDFGNRRCGDPVYAVTSGTVTKAGRDQYGAICVDIQAGDWKYRVAHLVRELVSVGQTITEGTHVGGCGSTGQSTGCHVHLGAWQRVNGVWRLRDPMPRLRQSNIALNGEGIRIRSTFSVASPSNIVASSKPTGIYRTDGTLIGPLDMPMLLKGYVIGGPYPVGDGTVGNSWAWAKVDGAYRYIAKPLTHSLA